MEVIGSDRFTSVSFFLGYFTYLGDEINLLIFG